MGNAIDNSPQNDSHHPAPIELDGTGSSAGTDDPFERTPDSHGSDQPDLSAALSDTTPDQSHWADSPWRLVSVADAAQFLNISTSMLYQMVATGQLATVKIGTRTLIPRLYLEEFVRGRSHRASWQ